MLPAHFSPAGSKLGYCSEGVRSYRRRYGASHCFLSMTFWTLIRRNLRFHARAHLGVVLGAAIGSAALIGALVVGDSVRESLTNMALRRLGRIDFALSAQDRLFQASLRERMGFTRPPDAIRVGSKPPAYIYPLPACPKSSALVLPGIVARQDGAARANRVNVLGVEAGAWPELAYWGLLLPGTQLPGTAGERLMRARIEMILFEHGKGPLTGWEAGETAFVNETLARQLAAREGDEIILRVRKPSALGLDAAISPHNEDSVAVRLKVGAILTADMLGDFSLTAQPSPPANLFLPMGFLSDKVGVHDQANLLVADPVLANPKPGRWDGLRNQVAHWLWMHAPRRPAPETGPMSSRYKAGPSSMTARAALLLEPKQQVLVPDELAAPWLNEELARSWLPEDAGLSVHAVVQPTNVTGGADIQTFVAVTSSRIFLEPAVAAAALKPRTVLLTNRQAFQADGPSDVAFAQLVTNGVRVLTYLANLIQVGDRATPYSMVTAADGPFVPADMRDDEILVNQWLADDLQVKPGDAVALSYYVVDSGSRLVERTNSFRVRQIVPLKGIYADRTLMPEFPGLAKAESTHDWDMGFPLVYPDSGQGRGLLEDLPRHAQGVCDSGSGSGHVGQPVRVAHGRQVFRCRPTPLPAPAARPCIATCWRICSRATSAFASRPSASRPSSRRRNRRTSANCSSGSACSWSWPRCC